MFHCAEKSPWLTNLIDCNCNRLRQTAWAAHAWLISRSDKYYQQNFSLLLFSNSLWFIIFRYIKVLSFVRQFLPLKPGSLIWQLIYRKVHTATKMATGLSITGHLTILQKCWAYIMKTYRLANAGLTFIQTTLCIFFNNNCI